MVGLSLWFLTIVVNLIIYFFIKKLLSVNSGRLQFVVSSIGAATITDIIVHIFIFIESGYPEMMMWFWISFPSVLIVLLLFNVGAKIFTDW